MKEMYENYFKDLVKAYYQGNFSEKVNEIINENDVHKYEIISALCGVQVSYDEDYVQKLEDAIKKYSSNHKVVHKVMNCSLDCIDINGETLCQKSCPFDAIITDKENHNSFINNEKCTDCGLCVEACKEGNILDLVEFIPLGELLKNNSMVIAAVAPAIMGQFGEKTTIDQLRSAFKKIGFTDMVEVAFFADILTLKEAVEFNRLVKSKNDFMITSCCCPMWVGMVKKVYHNLVKHVSPSVSPMIASGRVLKKLNPNCKVVFIGPCVAKKAEAKEKDILGAIDYVLTFQELKAIFEALNIMPEELEGDTSTEYSSRGGRLYARTGGVSIAVSDTIKRMFPEKQVQFKSIQVDGVPSCKELLSKVQSEEDTEANFIEGMGCVGGCVGGPKANISKDTARKIVNDFAENCEVKVPLDSHCMNIILKQLDINSADDFQKAEKIEILEREF